MSNFPDNKRRRVRWARRIVLCSILIGLAATLGGPAAADDKPRQGVRVAELTPAAEAAITKGLEWLAANQGADGSWGTGHKTAGTAVGLMAFMVKGYFPGREKYGDQLSKAVNYLLAQGKQRRGYMGRSMYEHGLATLALSEVWGTSTRAEIRDALKKAVEVIIRSQNPRGGWRYNPTPTDADISVTVMQIVALASAKEAGIYVPDKVMKDAVGYVKYCQEKKSGGFGYTGPSGPNFARSAAGVMSLLMCGERNSEEVKAGLGYLLKLPENIFVNTGHYFYAHYYAAQAMYQAGDEYYQQWYPKIREGLLKRQAKNGSWPGGQGIETPMAILIMGIPYRYLPIYQR